MRYLVKRSSLQGDSFIPPSKSHTLRAILFASLASGMSIIRNYLPSPDTLAMINACQQLGAQITLTDEQITVIGVEGKPCTPPDVINAGNSGQVLRFVGAVSALASGYTVLTGDASIRHSRPVQPLLDGLTQLNAFAVATKNDGCAPIIVRGPIAGGQTSLNGEDSQPVSGLLIAAAFAPGPTEIIVKNPGEKPWIDLTLDWFKRLGISYEQEDYARYFISGDAVYSGFEYEVPGDFSSAAFPMVAALVTQSAITLHNLDMDDVQGDKAIIPVLEMMGATFKVDTKQKTVRVEKTKKIIGQDINVNDFVDAVTILAVVACFAKNETRINGAEIARKKESDRLTVITQQLQKMGANIIAVPDGLIIYPQKLHGATVYSHDDHRVAMSLAVAALAADGQTIIENADCVVKSYPKFAEAMSSLGANIEERH
jgi:3-phosphoshikimate 1-carboxyvinyltransferase